MGACINCIVWADTSISLPSLAEQKTARGAVESRQFSFREIKTKFYISLLLIFYLRRQSPCPHARQTYYKIRSLAGQLAICALLKIWEQDLVSIIKWKVRMKSRGEWVIPIMHVYYITCWYAVLYVLHFSLFSLFEI